MTAAMAGSVPTALLIDVDDKVTALAASSANLMGTEQILLDPEKEEEEVILDNISIMNQFLCTLQNKSCYTLTTKTELDKLKKRFDKILNKNETNETEQLKEMGKQFVISKNVNHMTETFETDEVLRVDGSDSTRRFEFSENDIASSMSGGSLISTLDTTKSSQDSCCISTDTLSSDANKWQQKRKLKGKLKIKNKKKQGIKTRNEFTKMVNTKACLNSGQIPTMEKFDEESGSLRDYLESFEVYCHQYFRGLSRYWKGELEDKLAGDALKAFRAENTLDSSWETLKRKLIKSYNSNKTTRITQFRQKFNSVSFDKDQPVHLTAMKLEKLFKVAYPTKSVQHSKTLEDKFLSMVPDKIKTRVEDKIINHC